MGNIKHGYFEGTLKRGQVISKQEIAELLSANYVTFISDIKGYLGLNEGDEDGCFIVCAFHTCSMNTSKHIPDLAEKFDDFDCHFLDIDITYHGEVHRWRLGDGVLEYIFITDF